MNLNKILKQHALWLKSKGKKGQRAILRNANLKDAYLKRAILVGANLTMAYRPEGLKSYEIDKDGYII